MNRRDKLLCILMLVIDKRPELSLDFYSHGSMTVYFWSGDDFDKKIAQTFEITSEFTNLQLAKFIMKIKRYCEYADDVGGDV